ncbi:helix-turn-helix domain-containing protein [Halarcobacter bivalviorum]|uniref:AraC family transcriptional regulator n=1 Tax=Halarcobacter bivalviorum TaxID=663364 RepID=A0AAX2A8A5_9BACT|nr:AraC family transcriptional regulator [Halarcobacter bivalviorum]AXH11621.1 transcriptional regulator, AraC family [Halarcobacter bivalviorum]RXK08946.1 AraC family transcriptional regulator [Halarcobacter bivalviorum]
MDKISKIEYFDIFEEIKTIKNPFSRENFICNVKPEYGLGNYVGYDSGSGIAFFLSSFLLNQNKILIERSNVAGAVLIFNLGNNYSFTFEDNSTFELKKNSYFLGFCSDKFLVDVSIKKSAKYNMLTIGIKEELFLKLAHNLKNLNEKMKEAKNKNYAIVEGGQIDPEQKEILSAFSKKSKDEYLLTDLNLESKTMNLIEYTIKKIISNINSTYNLDKSIINSLEKAKKLINESYFENLTIKEIAYKSAINECYLKKDFKKYYGMTVYEMLQKQRLNKAKELLQEDFTVKEVCSKVGYKHLGNFSKLFQHYFNISPSKYKKEFN